MSSDVAKMSYSYINTTVSEIVELLKSRMLGHLCQTPKTSLTEATIIALVRTCVCMTERNPYVPCAPEKGVECNHGLSCGYLISMALLRQVVKMEGIPEHIVGCSFVHSEEQVEKIKTIVSEINFTKAYAVIMAFVNAHRNVFFNHASINNAYRIDKGMVDRQSYLPFIDPKVLFSKDESKPPGGVVVMSKAAAAASTIDLGEPHPSRQWCAVAKKPVVEGIIVDAVGVLRPKPQDSTSLSSQIEMLELEIQKKKLALSLTKQREDIKSQITTLYSTHQEMRKALADSQHQMQTLQGQLEDIDMQMKGNA